MRIPLPDRLDEAVAQMEARLAEEMYGVGSEERVRQLRESVLGPQPRPVMGLAAVLDAGATYAR